MSLLPWPPLRASSILISPTVIMPLVMKGLCHDKSKYITMLHIVINKQHANELNLK